MPPSRPRRGRTSRRQARRCPVSATAGSVTSVIGVSSDDRPLVCSQLELNRLEGVGERVDGLAGVDDFALRRCLDGLGRVNGRDRSRSKSPGRRADRRRRWPRRGIRRPRSRGRRRQCRERIGRGRARWRCPAPRAFPGRDPVFAGSAASGPPLTGGVRGWGRLVGSERHDLDGERGRRRDVGDERVGRRLGGERGHRELRQVGLGHRDGGERIGSERTRVEGGGVERRRRGRGCLERGVRGRERVERRPRRCGGVAASAGDRRGVGDGSMAPRSAVRTGRSARPSAVRTGRRRGAAGAGGAAGGGRRCGRHGGHRVERRRCDASGSSGGGLAERMSSMRGASKNRCGGVRVADDRGRHREVERGRERTVWPRHGTRRTGVNGVERVLTRHEVGHRRGRRGGQRTRREDHRSQSRRFVARRRRSARARRASIASGVPPSAVGQCGEVFFAHRRPGTRRQVAQLVDHREVLAQRARR